MILADKIIDERKRLGLSQEELADKLSVSRQAVSKWESAQSIPDLDKILAMSRLFGVSTDYLLKDEMKSENRNTLNDCDNSKKMISLEEAISYMNAISIQSKYISVGVLLCILCPIPLIILSAISQSHRFDMNESLAIASSLVFLFIMIAIAVYLFIKSHNVIEKYDYLKYESFETAYGVTGVVKERKDKFEKNYFNNLIIGITLCILSPLCLMIASIFNQDVVLINSMTALLMVLVAIGVYLIVNVSIVKESYQVLLQEKDYSNKSKKNSIFVRKIVSVYWSLVTAGYLFYSFVTGNWGRSWIIWPIAGVISSIIKTISTFIADDDNKE